MQSGLVGAEPHHDRRRTRVPYDVGEGLGGDPVGRLLDCVRQRWEMNGFHHGPQLGTVGPAADLVRADAQRLDEPVGVQGG